MQAWRDLIQSDRTIPALLVRGLQPKLIKVVYNRQANMARVEIEYTQDRASTSDMLASFKAQSSSDQQTNVVTKASEDPQTDRTAMEDPSGICEKETNSLQADHIAIEEQLENGRANHAVKKQQPSWTCGACTLDHIGPEKQLYLACELCGSARSLSEIAFVTSSPAIVASRKHCISPR